MPQNFPKKDEDVLARRKKGEKKRKRRYGARGFGFRAKFDSGKQNFEDREEEKAKGKREPSTTAWVKALLHGPRLKEKKRKASFFDNWAEWGSASSLWGRR